MTHSQFQDDRDAIRGWLVRSLLKASGIWGSGLDTLLTGLREVIQKSDGTAFPVEQLSYAMTQRGKSLMFEPAEIDDILEMEYGDRRMFPALSLLFPFVDLRNQFHIDHVYPISRFTHARLQRAGFSDDRIEALGVQANALPNLQLLEGTINNEKRATMPAEWLRKFYPDGSTRQHYCDKYVLGELPEELTGFSDFHAARRDQLRTKLVDLLCSPGTSA